MNRNNVITGSDATPFSMPSLEDENTAGGSEAVLRKAAEIQRQAYEEGFKKGEKAGFEEGEHKAGVLVERLEKILDELADLKGRMISELESQVVDLAAAVARKIIIQEIRTNPEIIVTMVKEALKRLQRSGTVTIRINPSLYDLFNKKKPGLTEIHEDIVFDVNPNVPVTGPLVIGETEEVVTDVESLLSKVVKEMKSISPEQRACDNEMLDNDND